MFKPILENNESTICGTCKSVCCKRMPGAVFPEQLEVVSIEAIVELLSNGYALDWWEGNPTDPKKVDCITYYMRPSIKGHEDKVTHPAWNGACIFHDEKDGCILLFKHRPLECQNLIPNKSAPGNCTSDNKYTKRESAIAWLPYQEMLLQAIEIVREKTK